MERRVLRFLFLLGLIVLFGWLIYQTTTIILYIILSLVVALIGRPIYGLFDKIQFKHKHLPDVVKAGLTLVAIFGILGGIIAVFIPMVFKEAQLLTNIDLAQVEDALTPALEWFNAIIHQLNIDPNSKFNEGEMISYLFERLELSALPDLLNSIAGTLGSLLIAIFSVAFITFFFLKDKDLLTDLVIQLVPRSKENRIQNILMNTRNTLSRYFLALLLQVIAISTCIFVGLKIAGIENALLIAVFTGVVNLIPYIGPWIGASFGIFILVANNIDASFTQVIEPKLIGLLIVFACTQLIDNYVIQPTIFSSSINAHPLEIFVVILVAGTLGGVVGMVSAIPVYSFLRIVFQEMNKEFLWLKQIKER